MLEELYPQDVFGLEADLTELFAPPAFAGEIAAAFDYGAFLAPPYDGGWGAPFAGYPAF